MCLKNCSHTTTTQLIICLGLFSSGAGGGQWVELGQRLEHLFTFASIAAHL